MLQRGGNFISQQHYNIKYTCNSEYFSTTAQKRIFCPFFKALLFRTWWFVGTLNILRFDEDGCCSEVGRAGLVTVVALVQTYLGKLYKGQI